MLQVGGEGLRAMRKEIVQVLSKVERADRAVVRDSSTASELF